MYTIGGAELAHCIVGSTDVLYIVFRGDATLVDYAWRFELPAALGNLVGGVLLVAIPNDSQTREELVDERGTLSLRT